MNGGVRVALAILIILGGIVLVVYAIQGMWPISQAEPIQHHPDGKPPEPIERG